MTEITVADIKILYFGLIFMSVVGVFVGLYSLQPIEPIAPSVSGSQGIEISVLAPSWITNLLSIPQPFADLFLVTAIFIIPISTILGIVAIRYAKDLASQWG